MKHTTIIVKQDDEPRSKGVAKKAPKASAHPPPPPETWTGTIALLSRNMKSMKLEDLERIQTLGDRARALVELARRSPV
jgi:hypothetical protein